MQLDKEHKRQIEEIISTRECPKDFVCYKSGFEKLSKVEIIGDAKLVLCRRSTDGCHCERNQPLVLGEVEGEAISIVITPEIATATFVAS